MNSSFAFQSMPGLSSLSPVAPMFSSGDAPQTSSMKPTNLYKSAKPSISVHQAEGGSLVLHTSGWAGVGLIFDGRGDHGFPLVKEVLSNGSAERDGKISANDAVTAVDGRTTESMGMQALRDMILGPVGSAVVLAVRKADTVRDVVLTRASTEFWALSDANKKMKEQLDALSKKLRDSESLANRQQAEVETLRAQRAELDLRVEKLRTELAEEKTARKRFESEAAAHSRDKKDLDESMESLLKKLSDTTLNFKTAERLARDMTEKARDMEQRKNNEERLRKMAEEREASIQTEVMAQTAQRREMEKSLEAESGKFRDYEQQVQNAAALSQAYKDLQHQLYGERQSAQTHLALTTHTEKKLQIAEETIARLKQDTDALKNEIVGHKQNLKARDQEYMRLSEEKKKMERDVEAAGRGKASAQSSTESANDRANTLQKRLRDMEAEVAGLQAEKAAMQDEVRSAGLQKAEVQRTAEAYAAKADACRRDIDDLRGELGNERQLRAAADARRRREGEEAERRLAAAGLELKQSLDASATQAVFEAQQLAAVREGEARALGQAQDAEARRQAAEQQRAQSQAAAEELEARVRELAAGVEQARGGQRRAELAAEGAKGQLAPLLEELGAKEQQAIEARLAVEEAKKEVQALRQSTEDAEAKSSRATRALSDLETRLKAKTLEAEGLGKTVQGVEAQLETERKAKSDAGLWESKVKSLEQQLATLQPDLKRLYEAEATQADAVKAVTQKYQELHDEYASTKVEMSSQHAGEAREMRNQLFVLLEERDYMQKEIDRYSSLPNPTGVGLMIDELVSKTAGDHSRHFVVTNIQPGMSADLSGVISLGDELLAVNEHIARDFQLKEIQEKVAGQRGSQVSFDFKRQGSDGKPFSFRVILKRGAWGPEHAVMSPEDLDMIDRGRWPVPGSVSDVGVDMAKVTRGTDTKVQRIRAVSNSFIAKATLASSQVPVKEELDEHEMVQM